MTIKITFNFTTKFFFSRSLQRSAAFLLRVFVSLSHTRLTRWLVGFCKVFFSPSSQICVPNVNSEKQGKKSRVDEARKSPDAIAIRISCRDVCDVFLSGGVIFAMFFLLFEVEHDDRVKFATKNPNPRLNFCTARGPFGLSSSFAFLALPTIFADFALNY